jgi:hypothetical protein
MYLAGSDTSVNVLSIRLAATGHASRDLSSSNTSYIHRCFPLPSITARIAFSFPTLRSSTALPTPGGRRMYIPQHIQKAFEYALKLKADTRLDEGYYLRMYRPGTPFNGKTMLTHPISGVQGQYVSLCVQAALLPSDDSLSDAITSYTASKAAVVLKYG